MAARRVGRRNRKVGNGKRSARRWMRMWIRIGAATAVSANSARGFSQSTALLHPREQKIPQRALWRRVGDDQRILKALGPGAAVPSLQKRRHRVGVLAPRQAGVDRQGAPGLQIREFEIA